MFKDAVEAERVEQDQDADCARIDAVIGLAKQDIAALRGQQVDPDELREKWSAIRDRTILAIRDVRRNVVERANEARETTTWMIEKVEQTLRAESDPRVIREFSAELREVPTEALLDYLRYLIKFGDVARIQSVRDVFAARADHHRYNASFERTLAQFALPKFGDLGERLVRICRSAEETDATLADLFSTHGTNDGSSARMLQRLAPIEAPTTDTLDNCEELAKSA
jgi:hypothetical protein